MKTAVTEFLAMFRDGAGRFRVDLPEETPHQKMVRGYEAREPEMIEVMKLVLPDGSTEAQELALWKERALAERAGLRPFVNVRHEVQPAGGDDLGLYEETLRDAAPDLLRLYQSIRSAQLYVDTEDPEGGLRFFPVPEMATQREYVRGWLEDDDEGFEESESGDELELMGMPPWLDDAVVFAGIGQAAERFVLACDGPHKGSVFAFEHDPLGMRRVAQSFEQFLRLVRNKPLDVAKWVGICDAVEYQHASAIR